MKHFYYGDGKGKTTAAMGLALRAVGRGIPAVILQFLKDGSSGEIRALRTCPEVTVLAEEGLTCFVFAMSEEEKERFRQVMAENLKKAESLCREGRRMLVLDEIGSALDTGMVERENFLRFLDGLPEETEVAMTGHRGDEELIRRADYVTRMEKGKHPYDKGVSAREGVEY